jgi:hypothetical protein
VQENKPPPWKAAPPTFIIVLPLKPIVSIGTNIHRSDAPVAPYFTAAVF